ncbi:MAG: trypsin-like peptidase domain-containing protein [Planctomycetia bacterium]|nr:trypsin-like peptidase domain-containing protein [Planctomycetia bacterium]
MPRHRSPFLCAALVAVFVHGPARAVPPAVHAVVRLPSHGASATVIETRAGATWLLGCAHAFEGNDRLKPIRLDVPVPAAGAPKQAAIRLLAVDHRADLSLIFLNDGPLPYAAPVAPAGHAPGRHVLSIGYDAMRWPAQQAPATLLGSAASTTYTREHPVPGRSGGALLDADRGWLIGVVQGYETAGPRRGLYVSHAAILRFLQGQRGPPPREAVPRPLPCPT